MKNIACSQKNQKLIQKKLQRNEANPGASVLSYEFLLGSTVRGFCRPESRTSKTNQKFLIAVASVNLILIYFPSSTLVRRSKLDRLKMVSS